MKKDNISEAFRHTLLDDSYKNISIDYFELGFDSFIKNDIIKEIPIIKTLYSFYKTVKSLQAFYLSKKIIRFLFKIKDVKKEEIEGAFKKLDEDKAYKKDIGENLILLLDRFETVQKADLLGTSFKMFLKEQLTYEEFSRIAYIIDKSFIEDLYKLPLIQKSINVELISKENLFSIGLLSLKPHDVQVDMTGFQFRRNLIEVDYILNDSGKLIIKLLEEK